MTTLDEFIAQQAGKPRYAQVVALDHHCDYGGCLSSATRIAVTALVDHHDIGTGVVELRGVCERHVRDIPATVKVAR
jgi:hypothetical protein